MRLGIFSNISRDIRYEIAASCADIIADRGSVTVFPESMKDQDVIKDKKNVEFGSFENCDVIISIGGDGTLLSAVSEYRDLDIPFIGINKGSIGFLTEIDVPDLESDLDKVLNGQYEIAERSQLYVEIIGEDGIVREDFVCLNDCVVTRGAKLNIVKMDLWIDGQYVEKFYGDGIIVSTPTGSTAYSLAAGGPILMPHMRNMIVTPLCPHTLQRSGYCLTNSDVIEIKLQEFESAPIISGDGRTNLELKQNDTVRITGYKSSIKTITLGKQGFFETVRSKISARGSFYEHKK